MWADIPGLDAWVKPQCAGTTLRCLLTHPWLCGVNTDPQNVFWCRRSAGISPPGHSLRLLIELFFLCSHLAHFLYCCLCFFFYCLSDFDFRWKSKGVCGNVLLFHPLNLVVFKVLSQEYCGKRPKLFRTIDAIHPVVFFSVLYCIVVTTRTSFHGDSVWSVPYMYLWSNTDDKHKIYYVS